MPAKPLFLAPLRRTAADAARFARHAHEGQTDQGGAPYADHLRSVARDVARDLMRRGYRSDSPECDDATQIAWLHDVLEDTEYTADDLLAEGFSRKVVTSVEALTKPSKAAYADWIFWLCWNAELTTILVKIADVEDNLDPDRLALLPEDVQARLRRKYEPALVRLKEAALRLGSKEMADV